MIQEVGVSSGRTKVKDYLEDTTREGYKRATDFSWANGRVGLEVLQAFTDTIKERVIRAPSGHDVLRWGYSQKGAFSIKEAYNLVNQRTRDHNPLWIQVWTLNPWPKVATFCWLVAWKKILTFENLRVRGIIGPSRCPLCLKAEETMGHLLDRCEFPSALWDRGAEIFTRSNRIRGHPELSLTEWDLKAFDNPIIQLIWQMFPGLILWHTWKERNNRIFRGITSEWTKVWSKIVSNVQETLRSRQWDKGARRFSVDDKRIAAGWDLAETYLLGIRFMPKICHPRSPCRWQLPLQNSYKVNFDGASRGNLGLAGFGGVCRNNKGEIMKVFFGQLGFDSNNSAELEGLIQGLTLVLNEGWLPATVEGDSKVLIGLAKKLAVGQAPGIVSTSWRLQLRLEALHDLLTLNLAVTFQHVRRDANKVVDWLSNQGIDCDSMLRIGASEEFR